VVHSLGNLVFDMDFSRQTQEGFLLELTFRGTTLRSCARCRTGSAPAAPRVVAGAAAAAVLAPVWANSGPPFKPAS
jgi:MYXO-CTERM domain-containing protein